VAFYISHDGINFPNVVSTTTLQVGRWYHVAGTFDGQFLQLYVNGVLEASQHTPGPLHPDTRPFQIGRIDGGGSGSRYFDGQISDVSMWNVARSQADIRASMTQPLTGTESGLVGYWPLDEGQGLTAHDLTANANNGTLSTQAPAWSSVVPGLVEVQ